MTTQMTTLINHTKRTYSTPEVEHVQIDNEIALTLDSYNTMPTGPDEGYSYNMHDSFNEGHYFE